MCVIVDTNLLVEFVNSDSTRFFELRKAFLGKRQNSSENCKWTVGGTKYKNEIKRVEAAKQFLYILSKAGRVNTVDDNVVDAREAILRSSRELQSKNDEVIIALALEAGVRLIVTEDRGLIKDFKNYLKPPGRVIQDDKHLHLVRDHCR